MALKDDIWEYLRTTLLPSVYNVPNDESDKAQFYLSDMTNTVIGVPRIRQLRIDHGKNLDEISTNSMLLMSILFKLNRLFRR